MCSSWQENDVTYQLYIDNKKMRKYLCTHEHKFLQLCFSLNPFVIYKQVEACTQGALIFLSKFLGEGGVGEGYFSFFICSQHVFFMLFSSSHWVPIRFSICYLSSQCVPQECSQQHLALIPYVLPKILPCSHVLVGQSVATPLWPSVGVKPNTPKVGDLESSGTPECIGFDNKAQNTSHRGVIGVIGKVLKRRYRKWPCIGHLDICSPSYGQKKGRESNWQFDS